MLKNLQANHHSFQFSTKLTWNQLHENFRYEAVKKVNTKFNQILTNGAQEPTWPLRENAETQQVENTLILASKRTP